MTGTHADRKYRYILTADRQTDMQTCLKKDWRTDNIETTQSLLKSFRNYDEIYDIRRVTHASAEFYCNNSALCTSARIQKWWQTFSSVDWTFGGQESCDTVPFDKSIIFLSMKSSLHVVTMQSFVKPSIYSIYYRKTSKVIINIYFVVIFWHSQRWSVLLK